ncbi:MULTISPECIES: hypothetical protein [Bartonella]|uniref:hypothetical protein n=1 Tax=Bartonella TaxID=773 RepID=UPI00235E217C|nr:hypothetical protein [Bartonella grahamii]
MIVVFLSNAIPGLAKKIDIIEQLFSAMAKAAKSYSQGKCSFLRMLTLTALGLSQKVLIYQKQVI